MRESLREGRSSPCLGPREREACVAKLRSGREGLVSNFQNYDLILRGTGRC